MQFNQQMSSIEEDLYRLRKQQLQAYLDSLEDEYQDKLDTIDARVEATTKAIQDQIDALNKEGKGSDREEATRKHNEKLADLQKQYQYHALRTGVEHQKAMADLQEQMAEENIAFQLQQEEWVREDKKEALQQQLDDAKDAADEEREQLKERYDKARQIAEDGILNVIASLAATSPKWLQTGKDLIDQLIDGLESGDFSGVLEQIEGIKDQVPVTTTPDVGSGSSSGSGGKSGGSNSGGSGTKDPSEMTWQELLVYFKTHKMEAQQEINRAGQKYTQRLEVGDIEGAGAAHHWANQIREAIGERAIYDENTASSSYHGYAKGGPILYDQIAKVHAGEYVIPANLVDAIRRGTMPPAQAGPGMGGGGGIIININAPLLAPEKLYLSDETDIRQVGDGLRKEIMALATAKG